jgi:hypothetical protein
MLRERGRWHESVKRQGPDRPFTRTAIGVRAAVGTHSLQLIAALV